MPNLSCHVRRAISVISSSALVLGTLSAAVLGGAAPAAAEETGATVQLKPNPSYQGPEFQGWGTSLVWFANATGGYPEKVRRDLFDKVFGAEGLNLNIARYNIGGGNATDVPGYLRPGGDVEGWWNPEAGKDAGITSSYEDREAYAAAWDPEDPNSYDFDADQTQRWWLDALAAERDDVVWEAFSNSPPYFLTQSGFVSGGIGDGNAEQLAKEDIDKYVAYLATVVQELEARHDVDFSTLDPFNEPNTNYWSTRLGEDGWPTSASRQEGAHIGPEMQNLVTKALAKKLEESGTDVKISAMDETNPGIFAKNWESYDQQARDAVSQLNVHTYGTGDRRVVRDIAKAADKPLWMSEVEGDWDTSGGHNLTNIDNGIGMAGRMIDDLRELEPNAWVFWQPVEDRYNMERVENLNWGSVLVDFDCNAEGNSLRRLADGDADPSCSVATNAKYNTVRNFTHYILPGDHVIPSGSNRATAALDADGKGLDVVHINPSDQAETIELDLSLFGKVRKKASVTPHVTTESPADAPEQGALVAGQAVAIDPATKKAEITVPAKSVTTLSVSGVSGIADEAAPVRDGGRYTLIGGQSQLALAAGEGGATIEQPATTAQEAEAQTWTATRLTGGSSNRERIALTDGAGRTLGVDDQGATLTVAGGEPATDRRLQWIPTTTNGSTWSLVNASNGYALDVNGESTEPGASVGTWRSSGGGNQQWDLRSTEPVGVQPEAVQTLPGVEAELPAEITPLYAGGAGAPVPVDWQASGVDWNAEGTWHIPGRGTDVFGNELKADLAIAIGSFSATDPVSVTSFAGAPADQVISALPATVPAQVGAGAQRFDTPVRWDTSGLSADALSRTGTLAITGQAESNDPDAAPLEARAAVILTAPGLGNIAPESTPSASFTEPGYSAGATINGDTRDKAWSNWKSGDKNEQDTLGYALDAPTAIEQVAVHFYRDGGHESWAQSLSVQTRTGGGDWVAAGEDLQIDAPDGGAPVATVDTGGVVADELRVVLTARENTHMIVAEVQILAAAPSPSSESSLARLMVDGVDVAGFDPKATSYALAGVRGGSFPKLSAVATDSAAEVVITQASRPGRTATVEVRAEDGSSTKYAIKFTPGKPE